MKKHNLDLKQHSIKNSDTLGIPLEEEEALGPTPPEDHHHMSKDIRNKVNIMNWVAGNRNDPALKVDDFS